MTQPIAVRTTSTRPAPILRAGPPRFLGNAADEAAVADGLADGRLIAFGFANFYAMASRPEVDVVRAANLAKGRPADQVGSLVTTPLRIAAAFDWSRVPRPLSRSVVLGLMECLWSLGPFGFRGPAADDVPDHLSQESAGVRTTQVIAPGYRCPSNAFVGRCLRRLGTDFLYITSANRSRHVTGLRDEPAHYRADALAAEFADPSPVPLLRHRDEARARGRYPLHDPMSTTVLAFHRSLGRDPDGCVRLLVERQGSLPLDRLERVVRPLGFSLVLGPTAHWRLPQRSYPDAGGGPASGQM
jgi:tRNA A37 threonylcarbamoyladenosine synthetase subunit TsaC/SUA5/YrdC